MPTVSLYPPRQKSHRDVADTPHPLPQLLQTPSGLAILEIQGTINLPSKHSLDTAGNNEFGAEDTTAAAAAAAVQTPVGRLNFPDYDGGNGDADDDSWQQRVHLYVGRYQRLTGEVKKLAKPLAVIQRRQADESIPTTTDPDARSENVDDLEVVEIVKHKIIFSSRPEPFGDMTV